VAVIAEFILCAGCSAHEPASPLLVDASLSISSAGQTVLAGQQSLQLTASLRESSGTTVSGQLAMWLSSDSTVASVSADGAVLGREPGSVTITATSDGAAGFITLTVVPPVAHLLVGLAAPGSLAVGGIMTLTATVVATNGDTVSGLPVSWSSADISRATVESASGPYGATAGLVRGISVGSVTITAAVNGITGSTTVVVVGPSAVASLSLSPDTLTFVATPLGFGPGKQMVPTVADAHGNAIFGASVAWSVSDPSAANVSSAGVVTPSPVVFYWSMVTGTVTGTVGAFSASVPIFVCRPVATIAVSTNAMDLSVGQTVVVVATSLDAHGHTERAPLGYSAVYANERAATVVPAGFDSVLVTGAAPSGGTLTFSTGAVTSAGIAIAVTGISAERPSDGQRRLRTRGR
jgi:hypothetical protein